MFTVKLVLFFLYRYSGLWPDLPEYERILEAQIELIGIANVMETQFTDLLSRELLRGTKSSTPYGVAGAYS